jgi:aspartate/methionine/tyrosine aminotransferase
MAGAVTLCILSSVSRAMPVRARLLGASAPRMASAAASSAGRTEGWESTRAAGSKPAPFRLERFFAKHEFTAEHLLCCSDVEPLTMSELLEGADDDARDLWNGLRLGYTQTMGLPQLLDEIAQTYGPQVGPQHLLECAPQEGVTLAMCALIQPGDAVVVAWPAYQSLLEIALSRGAIAHAWHARRDVRRADGAASLAFDVEDLAATLHAAAKGGAPVRCIVVNFPHNPTGTTLSVSQWARVVELARQYGAWLFADEMYRGLEKQPGETPATMTSSSMGSSGAPGGPNAPHGSGAPASPQFAPRLEAAVDAYEKGISLSGLSKVYGLPGLRIGWLACRDQSLLASAAALKDYTTICSSAPSQLLALMAMRRADELVARARGLVASGEAAAAAFFDKHAELFEYVPPQAGPIAFPALRSPRARAADVERYCEKLVATDSILLLPATVYGGGFDAPHLRVGLGRADCTRVFELWDASLERGLLPPR